MSHIVIDGLFFGPPTAYYVTVLPISNLLLIAIPPVLIVSPILILFKAEVALRILSVNKKFDLLSLFGVWERLFFVLISSIVWALRVSFLDEFLPILANLLWDYFWFESSNSSSPYGATKLEYIPEAIVYLRGSWTKADSCLRPLVGETLLFIK